MMLDVPNPDIKGKSEVAYQVNDYLFRLKEAIEISMEELHSENVNLKIEIDKLKKEAK